MPGAPIRHFEVDPAKLDAIHDCMAHYDVGSPDAEWPNNIISRKTVVYDSFSTVTPRFWPLTLQ